MKLFNKKVKSIVNMKLHFIMLFSLCAMYQVYGQSDNIEKDDYSFGVRGGLNYSTIGGDASGVKPRYGFHLGLFHYSKINPLLKIGTEFQYSNQGAQAQANKKMKLKYDYLAVAFMLKFYPPSQSFNIQVGPRIGYLLKATQNNLDIKDQLSGIDYSLVAGVGYEFGKFEVTARYLYGLSSTVAHPQNKMDRFPNRVVQLSVGYAF